MGEQLRALGALVLKHKRPLMGGGVLAGVALLGGQALRLIPKEELPELSPEQNAELQSHADLHGALTRMRRFGLLALTTWARLLDRGLQLRLLVGGGTPAYLSTPRRVAAVCTEMQLCVRTLRVTVKNKFPLALDEFDEVAGCVQEVLAGAQFNAMQEAASPRRMRPALAAHTPRRLQQQQQQAPNSPPASVASTVAPHTD
jgi:hypothetical protein